MIFPNKEQMEETGGSRTHIWVCQPPLIQCHVRCAVSYTNRSTQQVMAPRHGSVSLCWSVCVSLPFYSHSPSDTHTHTQIHTWAILFNNCTTRIKTVLKKNISVGTFKVLHLPRRRRREAIWLEKTQKICLKQEVWYLNPKNKKVTTELSSSWVLNKYFKANNTELGSGSCCSRALNKIVK